MSASAGPGESASQVTPLPMNAATATEAASARHDGLEPVRAAAGRKPRVASIRRAKPGGGLSRGSRSALTRRIVGELTLDLQRVGRIELAVEIGVNEQPRIGG